MKHQRTSLLFLFVGLVMVGVFVLWIFTFRETLHNVQQEPMATGIPVIGQQLRQPLNDITKSFTQLKDVIRQIPKSGALPPDAVATIEKKLQEQQNEPTP